MNNPRRMTVLEALFSSRVRVKLLEVFLIHPTGEHHSRELARLIGERQNSVWRELQRLEESGLLLSASHGNRKKYHVSRAHPLYPELRRLILKARGGKPEPGARQYICEQYRMPDCSIACKPSYVVGEND